MRTLLLLRGSPGCGKSTWIERRVETRTPSPLTISGFSALLRRFNTDGLEEINQKNDEIVWATLFRLL